MKALTTRQIIAHNQFVCGKGAIKLIDCWNDAKDSFFINQKPTFFTKL